jgi:hypothetical protein
MSINDATVEEWDKVRRELNKKEPQGIEHQTDNQSKPSTDGAIVPRCTRTKP